MMSAEISLNKAQGMRDGLCVGHNLQNLSLSHLYLFSASKASTSL
jgi:hypothetical protein